MSGPTGNPELPDVAFAVALAGLRDMTPARLRHVLDGRSAAEVFGQLLTGDPSLPARLEGGGPWHEESATENSTAGDRIWGASGSPAAAERRRARVRDALQSWREEARHVSVASQWELLRAKGLTVVRRGSPGFPLRLLRARQVPELLYVAGSLEALAGPCVGVVGTRRATHYGLDVAGEIGRGLAERGVTVVSGLARGIDGAAHAGVLAAGGPGSPVAVVGGGVDVVYPRENRRLWDAVRSTGGILSEAPPGAPPESWRFPLRNRIIAALSQILVVVESSRQGGAMHTVQHADTCGVPVLAVPGSVRSPQSEGTNAIIQEGGAGVALDVHDVLAALSLACEEEGSAVRPLPAADSAARVSSDGTAERLLAGSGPDDSVLAAVEFTATTVDRICLRTRLGLGEVALALDRLEAAGAVARDGAAWVRR